MYFRFTLFNAITLMVLVATLAMAYERLRGRLKTPLLIGYYAFIALYWFAFNGAIGTLWLVFGLLVAAVLRIQVLRGSMLRAAQIGEYVFLAYVLWRAAALILMLPW